MDFGDAMKAVLDGKKIKRKVWGGYWFIPDVRPSFYTKWSARGNTWLDEKRMNRMIIAKQKDDRGYSPAIPYPDDMMADDWEVIE